MKSSPGRRFARAKVDNRLQNAGAGLPIRSPFYDEIANRNGTHACRETGILTKFLFLKATNRSACRKAALSLDGPFSNRILRLAAKY